MTWLIVIFAYFLGSVPTAYIAGRFLRGKDIRQMGDGNVGAQNAYRQLGSRTGIAVGIVDVGKGILAILLAQIIGASIPATLVVGVAVVIGHNWPVFIGFRGGKGESATIGILLTVLTQPVIILSVLALAVLLIKKNVTLASVFLFVPLPLVSWWMGFPFLYICYGMALPGLVGFTHFLRTRQAVTHHV